MARLVMMYHDGDGGCGMVMVVVGFDDDES